MKRNISLITAISIVVTNMIGIGILTTPGVISSYLTSTGQVMLVWILGGLIALLGAVVYGQMGSLMPHSGGEFHYLSRIYHPILGTMAGWVSVIAGFAGPIALSSLVFAKYSLNITPVNQFFSDSISVLFKEKMIALLLILSISLFHVTRTRTALNFQLIITGLLIIFLILISFFGLTHESGIAAETRSFYSGNELNFGLALLLSVYSYTGWNASCYFAGHIRNPKRNLPLSLFLGVFIVIILYLAVNYGLMQVLGEQQLSGQIDFLSELGTKISGKLGNQLISATVLVILLASISSMIFAGSRIPLLKKNHTKIMHFELGRTGIAKMHILQVGIASLLIVFTRFQQLLLLLTIVLIFFTILTAFGIFLLPWKRLVVSKHQEIGVKLSAGALLLVLIWLVINSLGQFAGANFGLVILAVSSGIGLTLFLIFKKNYRNTSKQKLQVSSI